MAKNTYKIIFIFILVLALAIFLRLYQVDTIPPGVNRDEASIGYTAYSLLQTGKDEYGRVFPLSFQSFGDWKLPLYIYITTLTVSLFGLSELAVRLPSAIFGIATVALTFFLANELLQNRRLAFIAMLLTAIAPWHIHLSRVESESNTAVFFVTLAVLLFLKSIKGKPWLVVPSLMLFALTYFTYAGNYVFTTLLFIGTFFIYKSIPKTKSFSVAVAVFIVLIGFIVSQTMFGNRTKISGIGIFGDPAVVHAEIELPRNGHENPQSIFARALHNRVTFALERFGQNYLNAYSAQFLFIKGGDNKAHNIANFGNMYLVEAPFLLLGIIFLITSKIGKEKKLILWWFFVAPIAASLTKDAPHTNRMFAIFPILPIVVALGVNWVILSLTRFQLHRSVILFAIAMLFAGNIGLYLDRYFVHFPKNEAEFWGIGFERLSKILTNEQLKDKHVIMTKPETSPYIFILFYQAYDPSRYQRDAIRYAPTDDGFVHARSFDRYEFREINWGADLARQDTVLVARPLEIPDFVASGDFLKRDVTLPNGEPMFTIVETK